MAAATQKIGTTLRTALAVTLLAIATAHAPSAKAQSMGGPVPTASKAPANAKPKISGNPSRMLVAGTFYDFRPVASDPDSAHLQFSINKKPAWANFDASTGRLYGTPSAIDVGKIKGIQIRVSDGQKVAKLTKFGIKVIAGKPPVISGTPATAATEGQAYQFQPSASDADLQPLQFAITNRPAWASFDKFTGRLYGTPPAGSAGTYAGIGIAVTDGATTVSLPAFTITVAPGPTLKPPNTPAKISGTPPASVQIGQAYDFTPSASDPDGDTLTFASVNVPAWLSFDRATGRLYGKPQAGHEGTYSDIVISVNDGTEITFLAPFSVTVTAVPVAAPTPPPPAPENRAPTISGVPAPGLQEGKAYSFQPTASDADGDALTFSAANLPTWLALNPATGRVTGTAPTGSAGTYSGIVLSVTDGNASASLAPFAITVTAAPPVNQPPYIGGVPGTVVVAGQPYVFQPTAGDPEGATLRFSVTNKPSWLAIDFATGRLSGTPGAANVGTYTNIIITVSDGALTARLPAFALTVQAAASGGGNKPPTISGTPSTSVGVGQAYSFQPQASDPDGNALGFGIANKPAWADFDIYTGRLSGTPGAGDVGTSSNIVISVSDGKLSATLPAFSLTVQAAPVENRPPTISGTPSTSATVGQAYSFQPTASDPDGNVLAFGIANKPAWANFDIVTGRLSGTPAATDVGATSNIVISVSDAKLSATLPAFTITVAPPVTGSADLSWTAPTQNEDGSALTNLAGYKIRYGTSPGALDKLVDIVGAGITSAKIEGLAAGTWYFSMSSYTNMGVESAPTGTVSKTIQ